MYCEYYGFSERPFSLLPDPSFLYLGKKHQSALSMLLYSLNNQAGFCVLSGEIGAGKTTLIRELLDEVDDDVTVGLVNNYSPTTSDLLTNVLLAFGLDSTGAGDDAARHQIFSSFLIEQYAENRRTLLIFDEAQHLSLEVLESLRMLSNINADKDMLLQVMLVGQNELRDRLRQPELAQFAQRIVIDFHLQPLDQDETIAYIKHRIVVVGGQPEIFTRLASISVYAATNGIPRLINLLCDTALVYGYAEAQSKHISKEIINQVIRDRQGGSLLPLFVTENEITEQEKEEDFILDLQNSDAIDIEEMSEFNQSVEPEIADINIDTVKDTNEINDVASEPEVITLADIESETVHAQLAEVSQDFTEQKDQNKESIALDSGAPVFTEALSPEVRLRREEQIEKLESQKSLEEITLQSGSGVIPFQVHKSNTVNAGSSTVAPSVNNRVKKTSYLPAMTIAFMLGIVTFALTSFEITGEWLWETSSASVDFVEKLKDRLKI